MEGPFCKSHLLTCLFEMISLMFTGVRSHLRYINEMINTHGGFPTRGVEQQPGNAAAAVSCVSHSVSLHEDDHVSVRMPQPAAKPLIN